MSATVRRLSTAVEITGRMLTRRQAAEILAVPEKTLASWAYKRSGPRYFKVGRWTRYRVEDLTEWLESCVVETEAP
jgi:predicted DNA-binding transcriptional regulator AlpA